MQLFVPLTESVMRQHPEWFESLVPYAVAQPCLHWELIRDPDCEAPASKAFEQTTDQRQLSS